MIRTFEPSDTETVVKIWLDASIIAHNFMEASYWQSKTDDMRTIYLPPAITYVYEDSGQVHGFISMVENHVAALFVAPEAQGKGIGKQLLHFVKQIYNTLQLAVYKENNYSVEFYRKQGFQVIRESMDKQTGHKELIMELKNNG